MTANELVENAKELLGVKYVWGGNTPLLRIALLYSEESRLRGG